MKKIVLLITLLAVSGCIPSFQLKGKGEARMWDSYSVAVTEDVNELKTGTSILWTQDGPILEAIEFWKPLADGDSLPLNYTPSNADKAPAYRADMTPEEVVEMIRGSFALTALTPTKVDHLRPADFGTKQGYRVDLALSSASGDDFLSEVLFASDGKKLYALYFNGRATHYFEARKPVFDQIVSSIQF